MNQSKSGSPTKRAKTRKGPKMVPATEYNALRDAALRQAGELAQVQRQAGFANLVMAGMLAQAGGSIVVRRESIEGVRKPFEIRQAYDDEARTYTVTLVEGLPESEPG